MTLTSSLVQTSGWNTTKELSSGLWDGSLPTVVEFSARSVSTESGAAAACEVQASDGKTRYAVRIKDMESHVYRLIMAEGNAKLYVDNAEYPEGLIVVELKPDDTNPNSLFFGDFSRYVGGTSEWEFVRWKHISSKSTHGSQ